MMNFKPSKDIQTLSQFRANAAARIEQLQETRRPLVLTQHGTAAAVLLDVGVFDALMDELQLLRDIRDAQAELERGEGIPHQEVVEMLRAKMAD